MSTKPGQLHGNGYYYIGGILAPTNVAHRVDETIASAEVGLRRIGECLISVNHHSAMAALGSANYCEGISVTVPIVGQNVNGEGSVGLGCGSVIDGFGWIIDGFHNYQYLSTVGTSVSVRDCVGKAVASVEVALGCIGQHLALAERNGAVRTLTYAGDEEWISIDILVIGKHIEVDRSVFDGAGQIADSLWIVVNGRH